MSEDGHKEVRNKLKDIGIDVLENANLPVNDNSTANKNIQIDENSIIAPYALSNGQTWFAFGEANSDGISHLNHLEQMLLVLKTG